MANKRTKAANELKEMERIRETKAALFRAASKKLTIFPIVALCCTAIIACLFVLDWANIYNTTIAGKEVSVSGFNCLWACLTGNYSSADAAYGDMAVPFYYYAKGYCENLGVLTLIAAILLILSAISQIVASFTKKPIVNVVSLALNLLLAVVLIVCFIVALRMNDSQILPKYCSGNPACSIKSYVVIPAVFALINVVLHGIATFKYIQYKYE